MKDIYGLTDEEVIKSRQAHGANTLKEERRVGFFKRFFENLSDPIIKILLSNFFNYVINFFRS